ncbi:MAG: TonB-dependent receptor [Pseudomonadota bacterium]
MQAAYKHHSLYLALGLMLPGMVLAEEYRLPDAVVKSNAIDATLARTPVALDPSAGDQINDAVSWLNQVAGASVVRNGTQTGIVQLHGLFNERVKVRVDGMEITPACPNHMDPPLHYAPIDSLGSLQVIAGITPVSQGGDSIAGTVIADAAAPQFNSAPGYTPLFKLRAGYVSNNDASNLGLTLGTASQDTSLSYRGERLDANDYSSPNGTVRDTGYTTTRHDVVLARKLASGIVQLDAGQHATRNAGTPALPMDMIKDDADKVALSYKGEHAFGSLLVRAYWHDIDHLMDNYSLRPNVGMKMFTPATSQDTGFSLDTRMDRAKFGLEYRMNDFNAYSQNLATAARKDMFRDSARDRLGVYGEWHDRIAPLWTLQAGLRGDMVRMNTGTILTGYSASSSTAQRVQPNFNGIDRSRTDYNIDATLLTRYQPNPASVYEFGLAQKTRSPSTLERYLWSSQQSSAGQADGYNYLGNVDLKPEVSRQITAAAQWKTGAWTIKPGIYYNRVNDYIQGTSTGVIIDGKPVLQYQNINAELYGFDGNIMYQLNQNVGLGGILSYVRGKNTDNGDNLYRIAPLTARLYADYQTGTWNHRAELNLAARQNIVSAYNQELPTSGYGVVNLRTRWQASKALRLTAGVENLFDKTYYDHLGGINRVALSSVAIGGQLPGMGRSLYVGMEYAL